MSKGPEGVAQPVGATLPLVHAVVVSWNGAHLLPGCLRALLAQDAPARLIVTVVDNGSRDSTAEVLAREFPSVRSILLGENIGFGRANNEALRRALEERADFVALVNNDVRLAPDWLARLLDAAREHPAAGMLSGTLFFEPAEGAPEIVNSTGLSIDAFGRARDRDFRVPAGLLSREDGPVDGVSGGAALVRGRLLSAVGLFDPAYFAYYEDVDLSLRARRAGYECRYVRAARAWHRFGATFGPGSPQQRYLLGVGHLRTLALHQPLAKAAALVPLTAGYRAVVKAPLELLRLRPAHAWAELRAAVRGTFAALAALPRRLSGR